MCGACLGSGALRLLDTIGLRSSVMAAGAVSTFELRLNCGGREASVPIADGAVLSRSRLDTLLSDAAAAEGVDVRFGTRAEIVTASTDRATVKLLGEHRDRIVTTSVVVDATGLGRGVPMADRDDDAGGTPRTPSGGRTPVVAAHSRLGLGATVEGAESLVERGQIRMVVGRHGYVGLVRLECGRVNVAAAVDRDALSALGPDGTVAQILGEAGLDLAGAPAEDRTGADAPRWRGTPALTRNPWRRAGTRLFCVGDAAGYVEPFTGEGMGWAIASGVAVRAYVTAAIAGWDDRLAVEWERAWRRRIGGGQRRCRVICSALRRPALVGRTVALLARRPGLAAPFVRATGRIGRP